MDYIFFLLLMHTVRFTIKTVCGEHTKEVGNMLFWECVLQHSANHLATDRQAILWSVNDISERNGSNKWYVNRRTSEMKWKELTTRLSECLKYDCDCVSKHVQCSHK